jgi:hypothetical protein
MKDIKPRDQTGNSEKNNSFEANQEYNHITSQISSVTKKTVHPQKVSSEKNYQVMPN